MAKICVGTKSKLQSTRGLLYERLFFNRSALSSDQGELFLSSHHQYPRVRGSNSVRSSSGSANFRSLNRSIDWYISFQLICPYLNKFHPNIYLVIPSPTSNSIRTSYQASHPSRSSLERTHPEESTYTMAKTKTVTAPLSSIDQNPRATETPTEFPWQMNSSSLASCW